MCATLTGPGQCNYISSRVFVNYSRIDYGNSLFANAPKIWTDKLQRAINAAARVISGTRKFDRGLTRLLHDDLHWLDIPQHITFKLCLLVFKCLHEFAPRYLAELCVPVADVMGRRNLHSATRGLLNFRRYNMTSYGRRAFSYAGPHAWKSLQENLRQTTSIELFKRSLKTFIFRHSGRYRAQRIETFLFNGPYKFTYLLTLFMLCLLEFVL